MKESDGAEQPTTEHLRRARLGRITLWKSYALIRQEKPMIRGATGFKNARFLVWCLAPFSDENQKIRVSFETPVLAQSGTRFSWLISTENK